MQKPISKADILNSLQSPTPHVIRQASLAEIPRLEAMKKELLESLRLVNGLLEGHKAIAGVKD